MNTIDLIVFAVFTLGVVLFGCSFYRKGSSAHEFTAAGRSLPGWVVGMSIFATYVSSISYIGYPGKAFASNWNAFVFSLSIPIAAFFAARYFVPFYRHSGSISAYAFLQEKFGRWARLYASACYLLTQVARMGSILYLLAMPMHILMGWDMVAVIIATSVCVIVYSMLGGLKAVIWADAIQGIILIGGALLCLGILLFSMPEGPLQTFQLAMEPGSVALSESANDVNATLGSVAHYGNKFSLGSFGASLTESTFWVCLIYGIFINLQNYGIDQNYVQRYHTAKSLRAARFSVLFGGYLFIPVSALFFLIGTALYSYYASGAAPLPSSIASQPDYVFPYFIVSSLPVGLRGLLIASIFAAGMSTVSTSITSAATVILTDYIQPLTHRKTEKPASLTTLRICSVVMGILGMLTAIAMLGVKSIVDAWWILSGIFSGGMLGLFLLGILPRRVSHSAALVGCLTGIVVIAWISLAGTLNLPGPHLHEYLAIVMGTTTIFLTGFLATTLFSHPSTNFQ